MNEEKQKNYFDILYHNLDGYPLQLPARYSNKTACYTKVYIASQGSLSTLYPKEQDSPELKKFLDKIDESLNCNPSLPPTRTKRRQQVKYNDEIIIEVKFIDID